MNLSDLHNKNNPQAWKFKFSSTLGIDYWALDFTR